MTFSISDMSMMRAQTERSTEHPVGGVEPDLRAGRLLDGLIRGHKLGVGDVVEFQRAVTVRADFGNGFTSD